MTKGKFLAAVVGPIVYPILPILVFLELWVVLHSTAVSNNTNKNNWRDSFLKAAVAWAGLVFGWTEILSLRSHLRMAPLVAIWLASLLLGSVLVAFRRGREKLRLPRLVPMGRSPLVLGIVLVFAITGTIAFYAAPNNWDSMTYHLARVAHWSSNGSVAHYPTNTVRQIWMSPLAEYIELQFYILTGGSDRLVNLVQWFSLVGSVIAASRIVAFLGQSQFAQSAAGFIAATTPILILQSSSTQNDLVCAFFVSAAVLFLLSEEVGWTGLALGLAVATKATAVLFLLPFFVVAGVREYRGRDWMRMLHRAGVVLLLVAMINAPIWIRNQATFGSPLGYPQHVRLIESGAVGPGALFSNTIRNLALQMNTRSARLGGLTEKSIRTLHHWLGLDPDDSRTTWPTTRFSVPAVSSDEDLAGNPFAIVLLVVATFAFALSREGRRSEAMVFICCVWGGFLLFCWRITWMPWNTRLHVPFFVLASVPIGLFIGKVELRSRTTAMGILVLAAATAIHPLFFNQTRPLLTHKGNVSIFAKPRVEQYFVRRPKLFATYDKAIGVISESSCRDVGLVHGEEEWDYPLWALARTRGTAIQFRDLNVRNQTRRAARPTPPPCATFGFPDMPFGVVRDDFQIEVRFQGRKDIMMIGGAPQAN